MKKGIINAFQTRYPEPVAVIVTMDSRKQRANISSQGWFMFTSFTPPMVAISVANTHHTCETIRSSGEFVLALPSTKQVEAVYFCGMHSGREHDKFRESGFKPQSASKIKPPLIADACANFECKVASSMPSGDHTLFIGEIVASHVADHFRERLFSTSDGKFSAFGGLMK